MFCIDAIVSWFSGARADERIQALCLLLDCSLPLEIRFLGTYLETLAQKDYQAFRQAESNGNNPADLSCLCLMEDQTTLHKLCVSLALLHSSNRQGAAVIFGILSEVDVSAVLERERYAELALLLRMSIHHPAFSFHQKCILQSKLDHLKQRHAFPKTDLIEVVSNLNMDSCIVDPDGISLHSVVHTQQTQLPVATEGPVVVDDPPSRTFLELDVVSPTPEKSAQVAVFVKELKVRGIKKRADSKPKHDSKKRSEYEYILEVTWGDDQTKTVRKSYEDMFAFQCKLRKMYPTKLDEDGQPWKLPFLPGLIRLFNKAENKGEKSPIPDIADYTRLFGSLPKFVRGCDHVVKFFQAPEVPSTSKEKSTKGSKKDEKSTKGQSKKDAGGDSKLNSPHKIAEAVRDQSLTKSSSRRSGKKTAGVEASSCENKGNSSPKHQAPEVGKALVDENSNVISIATEKGTDVTRDPKLAICKANGLHGKNGVLKLDESTNRSIVKAQDKMEEADSKSKLSGDEGSGFHGKNGFVKCVTTSQGETTAIPSPSVNSSSSRPLSGDSLPFHPQFSRPLQATLQLYGANGLHSSLPTFSASQAMSLSTTVTSSYPASLPSPTESLVSSPVFQRSFSTGSLNWGAQGQYHAMSVRDWLKSLRLHKYSQLSKRETFDELLKLSDADLDKFGLTAGARRRLCLNLETLRTRGCFTSNGAKLVDVLQIPANEAALVPAHNSADQTTHSPSISSGSSPFSYNSDTSDFVHSWSESDSASDCSIDHQSESGTQFTFTSHGNSWKSGLLNSCRLSCYNCGSLGHVGGQCMAPSMDRIYYGYHLTYDEVQEC